MEEIKQQIASVFTKYKTDTTLHQETYMPDLCLTELEYHSIALKQSDIESLWSELKDIKGVEIIDSLTSPFNNQVNFHIYIQSNQ